MVWLGTVGRVLWRSGNVLTAWHSFLSSHALFELSKHNLIWGSVLSVPLDPIPQGSAHFSGLSECLLGGPLTTPTEQPHPTPTPSLSPSLPCSSFDQAEPLLAWERSVNCQSGQEVCSRLGRKWAPATSLCSARQEGTAQVNESWGRTLMNRNGLILLLKKS